MTKDPTEVLADLADDLSNEFDVHRQSEAFKDISLVIENTDTKHPTLIVHIDSRGADALANRIEEFLREEGARTERERHSDTDIRVLATVD